MSTVVIVVVAVVFALMVGELPYVIVKTIVGDERVKTAEPTFDHLEPIDLDDKQ